MTQKQLTKLRDRFQSEVGAVCIGPGLVVNSVGQLTTTNPPACRIFHSVVQSIANNTLVTLAFNSESYDNDLMHDTAVNNSRITFNTAGVYLLTACIEFQAAGDYTTLNAQIQANGSIFNVPSLNIIGPWANAGEQPVINLATIAKYAVGEFIEVKVVQINSAAAARNVVNTQQRSTFLQATRVGTG